MTETKTNENKTVYKTESNGVIVQRNVGTMYNDPKTGQPFPEPKKYDSYTVKSVYNGVVIPTKLTDEVVENIVKAYSEAKNVKLE